MLRELRVGNLALVEDLVLPLGPGLTIITGETGAGKSLVAGALGLLSGAKAQRDSIRRGEDLAYVEGVFDLSENDALIDLVRSQGVRLAEDGILVLRRELRREGRGRVLINGLVSSLALLQELGERLLAVQSQDQQRELTRPGFARDFLDEVLGLEPELTAVRQVLADFRTLNEELGVRRREEEFARQQLEMWEYQLRELQEAGLDAAEEENLAEKIALGRNSRALLEAAGLARHLLTEGEVSARDLLGRAAAALQELTEASPRLADVLSRLLDAQAVTEEAGGDLERFLDGVDVDPSRLDELEERQQLYADLARKYQREVPELISFQEELETRVRRQRGAAGDIADLENRVAAAREALAAKALRLRQKRLEGAGPTARRAREMVAPLALPDVELDFAIDPDEQAEGPVEVDGKPCAVTSQGLDRVQLLVRTNRGEPFGPVGQIASGGEKSRLYLALSVLAQRERTGMLRLFDEIDAGLGMDNAVPVARLLSRLAGQGQVLCISHLPTVATHGSCHFKVAKEVVHGRTVVSVRELAHEERVEEIRRLLGGALPGQDSAASQEDYARRLLASHQALEGQGS